MNLWETFLCLFVWRGSVTPLRVSFFIALSFTQREMNFSQWVILKTLTAELNYSDLYFERSVYCSCSWCLLFSCWRINTLAQPLYLYISYQCVLVLRQIRWNKIWKDPKQTKQNKKNRMKPEVENRGWKQLHALIQYEWKQMETEWRGEGAGCMMGSIALGTEGL